MNKLLVLAFIPLFSFGQSAKDYFEQARLWNTFCIDTRQNNSFVGKFDGKNMPTIDPTFLIYLPHKQKLDLSVLLTASILFPIILI